MHSKVTTWVMTPEQLAEYVAKHPIIPTGKPKGSSYENIYTMQNNKRKKSMEGGNPIE